MTDPEDFQLMTPEEITARIHALGKHGDDAASRWALKLLHSQQQADTGLPPPLQADEFVERLARLMKAAGKDVSQIAYRKAFALGPKIDLETVTPSVQAKHLPEDARRRIARVTSLRMFYKLYPEVRKPGVPVGYPRTKGIEAVQVFLRGLATQVETSRMAAQLTGTKDGDAEKPPGMEQGQEHALGVGQQG